MRGSVTAIVLNWKDDQSTAASVASIHLRAGDSIVIVNNEASPEDTIRLRSMVGSTPKIIGSPRNLGFGAGVNLARGSVGQDGYVLLVNNDLVVERNTVDRLRDMLDSCPNVGIAAPIVFDWPVGQTVSIQTGGGTLRPWRGTVSQMKSLPLDLPNYVTFACALFRKELLDQLNWFDESYFMYWEDVDFCQRALTAGWRLSIVEDAHAWHELSAAGKRGNPVVLTYGTWSASIFAKRRGGGMLTAVRIRAVLSAARRLLLRRPAEARALLRGLALPTSSGLPGYVVKERHQL